MKYQVFRARMTWDEYSVEADSAEQAKYAVENGQVAEKAIDTQPAHDGKHDIAGDVTVIVPA